MPDLSQLRAYAAGLPHLALRGRGGSFTYDGRRLPYFYAHYNFTWLNERAVEIPLALAFLDALPAGGRTLEVGNVLAHYGRRGHLVVDKYEQAEGVRNIDVLTLPDDGERFDAIVSISTVEHVGVDDETGDPSRAIDALMLLMGRLAPGGRLLVTVPVGYNPTLDRVLADGAVEGAAVGALLRTGPGPRWEQAPPDVAAREGYDHDGKTARGLLVVRAERPSAS